MIHLSTFFAMFTLTSQFLPEGDYLEQPTSRTAVSTDFERVNYLLLSSYWDNLPHYAFCCFQEVLSTFTGVDNSIVLPH